MSSNAKTIFLSATTATLVATLTISSLALAPSAHAESITELNHAAQDLQAQYDEAVNEIAEIDACMEDADKRIEQIQEGNAEVQKRSDDSMVALYKLQSQPSLLVDMFLDSKSLKDAMDTAVAYDAIVKSCTDDIRRARDEVKGVQEEKEGLTRQKESLQSFASDKKAQLEEVTAQRDQQQAEIDALLDAADNSSLARFSASMAYSKKVRFSEGYPATAAYKKAWETVLPGDSIPCGRSCDRGVMIPIRLFGLDNSFPTVCTSQFHYMQSSDKWIDMGVWNGSTSSLKPGDVLVSLAGVDGGSYDHSCMYVGYDIAQEMYDKVIKGTDGDLGRPGPEAVFSSASYQWGSVNGTALCLRSDGEDGSHVFRCVKPDKASN